MSLDHKQKRYIKRSIRDQSIDQISQALNVDRKSIESYLKERWGEEKFNRYQSLKDSQKNNSVFDLKDFFKKNIIYLIFLTVLILITYINSLNNAFVSDDIGGIVNNPDIGNLSNVFKSSQNMVQTVIYFIIYKLFGLKPIIFRTVNILFHLAAVFTVYILVSLLASQTIAFFTSSIFAVHPVLIESVTWISGGNYIRYSFFFLASFIFYLLSKNNRKYYYISILFFILTFFSSEKSIVLFLIFLLYEFTFSNIQKNWKKVIPFILISSCWGLFYILKISERVKGLNEIVGTSDKTAFDNPLIKIPVAITTYLQLTFFPDKLTLYHSELFFSQLEFTIRLLFTLLFFGIIAHSYKKNKIIFFWLVFFLITLIPTLTPLRIAWVIAERYIYLGTVGIVFIFSFFLNKLCSNKKTETIGYLIFILIIISLTTRTIIRNFDWKNEDSIYIATGITSPSDPKTHNNLGDVYGRRGDLERSVYEFKKAIELLPTYADAYHNLGNAYSKMAKYDDALKSYQAAIKYNPRLWQSYQNIAALYFQKGKFDLASQNIKKAISISPNDPNLYSVLGIIYLKMSKKELAKEAFMKALNLNPNHQTAKMGLVEANK